MNKNEQLHFERKAIDQLEYYGEIYVNYYSSDCDGGESGGSASFKSLDEIYKWWDDATEWADGPFRFHIVEPQDRQDQYLYFTR